ncbi:MAG: acyltransferase, partial [Chitinophagaceae bacterium]|nr:acyltransferase [Chitinophagaceae bacterium]
MDNIKVFLTFLVVCHHAAQAYGPTGGMWPVQDKLNADYLRYFFFVNASFMMGLYFFISGYFMTYSLQKKTISNFIIDRLKKLGIPLVFFTCIVFLPFNYILSNNHESIFQFLYNTYFFEPPKAVGHLWFVASLLAYSFLFLIIKNPIKRFIQLKSFDITYKHIFVYIILLSISSGLIRLFYPIDVWKTWLIPVEVAHIPQYLSLFLIGIFFHKTDSLRYLDIRIGTFFILLSISAFILHFFLPESIAQQWLVQSSLESILCVGLSIGLISFFKSILSTQSNFMCSLSANAYGIYLV